MNDETKPQGDPAVDAELAGVPDDLLEKSEGRLDEALDPSQSLHPGTDKSRSSCHWRTPL